MAIFADFILVCSFSTEYLVPTLTFIAERYFMI